ncbi:MAG: hypothetical protein KAJ24_00945 [Candidatus Aenigmarchaeota archaeon]|nr:hypothetical protein [Candidatus Aenigmarchaeota archaeon]
MAGRIAAESGLPAHSARTGHGIMLGVVLIAVGLAIKSGLEFADILIIVGIVLLLAKLILLKTGVRD